MLILNLEDNKFPKRPILYTRVTARAVVINEEGKIAIHHIKRNDIFGNMEYFETPGGGVDEGETIEEAAKRECEEELGFEVEIIEEIGQVNDFYNQLHRKNENHYFLAKTKKQSKVHFVSDGDSLIVKTTWEDINQAIRLFECMSDELVSGLVKNRELPILKEAKSYLDSQKNR